MGVMWGVIAAFAAMVCWGVGDFLIQRSTRKAGDLVSLAFIGILGAIGLLPFVWGDLNAGGLFSALVPLVILGVVHFGISWINFEALREGKLSVVDVILEFELVLTIFVGIFILGDVLSVKQFILIVPIFLGIVLMAVKKSSHWKSLRLERGVVLAIIAAVGLGVVNSLTGYSIKIASPFLVIWASWTILGLCSLVVILLKGERKHLAKSIRRDWGLLVLMAVIDTLAWVFYAFAVDAHSLSIATALTEGYTAIALLLGVFINRERLKWHQYLGAAVVLIASVALALTL